MANKVIATFYLESPEFPLTAVPSGTTLTAQLQSLSNGTWTHDTSSLTASAPAAETYSVGGQTRYRYRVDVSRLETATNSGRWQPEAAGTTYRRLVVTLGSTTLTRDIYLTVQPEVHVYRENPNNTQTELVRTDISGTANPANRQKTLVVNPALDAIAAREILLNGSNAYKGNIFVKANFPINAYCEDLTPETAAGLLTTTWLLLQNKIHVTRYGGGSQSGEQKWVNSALPNIPAIKADGLEHYVELVTSSLVSYPVNLQFEKLLLAIPRLIESALSLRAGTADRYTGVGTNTTTSTLPLTLPLTIRLTMPHAIKVTPPVITLDEDNNYTSFITVETNDGDTWSLPTNHPSLTFTPSTGTGRTAVVIKKDVLFNWNNLNFHDISITATSTVDAVTITSDLIHVHLERYTETRNALIPKQSGASLAIPSAWESFKHTLTDAGSAGAWAGGTFAVNNLAGFPTIDVALDQPHRIRSWSLQSVNTSTGQRATRLILSGRTMDGQWKILDDTGTLNTSGSTSFYHANKPRIDRPVRHTALVNAIRITAVSVTVASNNNPVIFPQIQVFAGEPIVPVMTSSSVDGVTVYPTNQSDRRLVFDRNVGGNNTASAGAAAWYLLPAHRNDVAYNGIIRRFVIDPSLNIDSSMSLAWIAVSFPARKLLGYLYSIDNANIDNPYAASLYFESRTNIIDPAGTDSVADSWNQIGFISFDKCIGNCFGITPNLANEQATLDSYAQSVLGLTGAEKDNAFIIDDNGGNSNIIQYNHAAEEWQNKGMQFTDVINNAANRTHYADFANSQQWAQLRFSVKSLMNTESLTSNPHVVAMPEMQFFGLPTSTINAGVNIASVSYLKAEDADGNLYDILGTHRTLPWQKAYTSSSTTTGFRFHVGAAQNIKPETSGSTTVRKLYMSISSSSGTLGDLTAQTIGDAAVNFSSSTNYASSPAYYEVYVYSASNEKIILSSGYTGVPV